MTNMAVTVSPGLSVSSPKPLGSFTMSMVAGWDLIPAERGGRLPCAGDVVLLEVRKPGPPVTGPAGWEGPVAGTWNDEQGREHPGSMFWKMIGPHEMDPTFHAPKAAEWEVHGYAVTGIALADGSGSGVPWEESPALPDHALVKMFAGPLPGA